MAKSSRKTFPTCTLCGGAGAGHTFRMFDPLIGDFGTACVACEDTAALGAVGPKHEDERDLDYLNRARTALKGEK